VVPVEGRSGLIFGLHHQRESGNLRTGGTGERIGQQRATKTLALECLIDSQAAHANSGHSRIARQLFADAGWKISQQQTCRCQSVIARDAVPIRQGHKTGGYVAANVLSDLLSQVAI